MRRLGMSVYPNHKTINEIVDYIHLSGKYGFEKIFTCLLSVSGKIIDEVIADLDPTVFKNLNASIYDLKLFKEIGLIGIRLDMGFSVQEQVLIV